jgi:hypothetical protein
MPVWATIDKKDTEKVIQAVKNAGEPALFSSASSEGKCAKLPFYRDVLLYRITNFASLPAFHFDYLCKDKRFFYLDGTFEPLYGVNQSDNFILSEGNLIDYVTFYFTYVRSEVGEIRLLTDIHAHAGLDSLPPEEIEDLSMNDWDAQITHDQDANVFILSAVIDNAGALVRATMEIDKAGRITITDQKLLSETGEMTGTGS